MLLLNILFWTSLLLLVHGLILFPKLTPIIGIILKKEIERDNSFEPKISLFIPAYNEEKVIAKKIENALSLDYPMNKFEIMICSDCSDDKTGEIVREYVEQYNNITFFDYRERSGKTGMINKSIPKAFGDIVLLTDANTMFENNAIRKIVSAFSSEKVGAVLGQVKLYTPEGSKGLDKEVSYRAFETDIKYIEGLFGCAMGAFGGFYAIRKELFTPLPANAYSNDDFLTPVKIMSNGYDVVMDKEAISSEETGMDVKEEFGRRIRIGAGNFQAFSFLPSMLNPFRFKQFYFYFSHKVIRWFSPFILLTFLISSITLTLLSPSVCFTAATVLQGILYVGALLGWVFDKAGKTIPVLSTTYHFTAMNIGLFLGFFRFAKGIKSATWNSTERVEE